MYNIDDRFLNVNSHGVLTIPAELYISMFLMIRYWLYFIALIITPDLSTNNSNSTLEIEFFSILVPELTAALVIFSALSRHPSSGRIVRFIWRHGIKLLILPAAAHLIHIFIIFSKISYFKLFPELLIISFGILDVIIIYSLLTSKHTQQVFKEFPEENSGFSQGI